MQVFAYEITEIRKLIVDNGLYGRTTVFILSAIGKDVQNEGHYIIFGPKIKNVKGITVNLSSFYLMFCELFGIKFKRIHPELDTKHATTLKSYIRP